MRPRPARPRRRVVSGAVIDLSPQGRRPARAVLAWSPITSLFVAESGDSYRCDGDCAHHTIRAIVLARNCFRRPSRAGRTGGTDERLELERRVLRPVRPGDPRRTVPVLRPAAGRRTAKRQGGKGVVRTCRSRAAAYHKK